MDAGARARLTVYGHSDVGRRRLANEDALHHDARLGLYVVCDGIGGQPSGEAASQTVAYALPHVFRRRLRAMGSLDDASVSKALALAMIEISAGMFKTSRRLDALRGMGATVVGLLIDRGRAFVFHAGDSRVYRLRGGAFERLTRDHVQSYRRVTAGTTADDEVRERRLLHQFAGMSQPMQPDVRPIEPVAGDRYLLCTDGVCDPLADPTIEAIVKAQADPVGVVRALIEAANQAGGPDNITATAIDYLAPTGGSTPAPPEPSAPACAGVAAALDRTLADLENDLTWLLDSSRDIASRTLMSASAAVKRQLGPQAYHDFLRLHPADNPSHVFHQACTLPDGQWRRAYQQHLDAMAGPMNDLDRCRLCPVLSAAETAAIFRSLWREWRNVERRYFAITQRAAMGQHERSLDTLIDHMQKSVVTLRGLLRFYPRFLRSSGDEAADAATLPGDTGGQPAIVG
jgi:protein phosphatase